MLAATITMKPSCILRKPPPRQKISFFLGQTPRLEKLHLKCGQPPPKKTPIKHFRKTPQLTQQQLPSPPKKTQTDQPTPNPWLLTT